MNEFKYHEFLKSKINLPKDVGILEDFEVSDFLLPHQKDIVKWAVRGGRRALFESFGGLATVPFRAIKLGRKGVATELNHISYKDGLIYCRQAESEMLTPSLFDCLED